MYGNETIRQAVSVVVWTYRVRADGPAIQDLLDYENGKG